jgi:thiol:disulfide interchange protein
MRLAVRSAPWVLVALLIASGCSEKKDEVRFAPYSAEAATAAGRPVVVLATADWCNPCQKLHRGALSDATVKAALEPFSRLEIDHSSRGERSSQMLSGLKIDALPTLLFLDARGTEVARLVGDQTASEIIDAAKKASGR